MDEDWVNSYGEDLTDDEIESLNLRESEVKIIDDMLMHHVHNNWQKVALIVVKAFNNEVVKLHDEMAILFYAMRIRKLLMDNKLETRGDLFRIRFSEVRLPSLIIE